MAKEAIAEAEAAYAQAEGSGELSSLEAKVKAKALEIECRRRATANSKLKTAAQGRREDVGRAASVAAAEKADRAFAGLAAAVAELAVLQTELAARIARCPAHGRLVAARAAWVALEASLGLPALEASAAEGTTAAGQAAFSKGFRFEDVASGPEVFAVLARAAMARFASLGAGSSPIAAGQLALLTNVGGKPAKGRRTLGESSKM